MEEWNKQEGQSQGVSGFGQVLNAKKDEPKVQAFQGQGISIGGSASHVMSDEDAILIAQYGDDPELLQAIKASMNEAQINSYQIPEEPGKDAEPSTVCTVQLRGPNGNKFIRRFAKGTTTLNDLINYFKKETNDNTNITLVIPLSKKDLSDPTKTLAQLQFAN